MRVLANKCSISIHYKTALSFKIADICAIRSLVLVELMQHTLPIIQIHKQEITYTNVYMVDLIIILPSNLIPFSLQFFFSIFCLNFSIIPDEMCVITQVCDRKNVQERNKSDISNSSSSSKNLNVGYGFSFSLNLSIYMRMRKKNNIRCITLHYNLKLRSDLSNHLILAKELILIKIKHLNKLIDISKRQLKYRRMFTRQNTII